MYTTVSLFPIRQSEAKGQERERERDARRSKSYYNHTLLTVLLCFTHQHVSRGERVNPITTCLTSRSLSFSLPLFPSFVISVFQDGVIFQRKKLNTGHVVPNCYRTPIPKISFGPVAISLGRRASARCRRIFLLKTIFKRLHQGRMSSLIF